MADAEAAASSVHENRTKALGMNLMADRLAARVDWRETSGENDDLRSDRSAHLPLAADAMPLEQTVGFSSGSFE